MDTSGGRYYGMAGPHGHQIVEQGETFKFVSYEVPASFLPDGVYRALCQKDFSHSEAICIKGCDDKACSPRKNALESKVSVSKSKAHSVQC